MCCRSRIARSCARFRGLRIDRGRKLKPKTKKKKILSNVDTKKGGHVLVLYFSAAVTFVYNHRKSRMLCFYDQSFDSLRAV